MTALAESDCDGLGFRDETGQLFCWSAVAPPAGSVATGLPEPAQDNGLETLYDLRIVNLADDAADVSYTVRTGGRFCAGGGPDAYLILRLTNEKRAANVPPLPPLKLNPALSAAACRQSYDMYTKRFMRHIGSDGSTFAQRITEAGYAGAPRAENIAQNYPDARAVFAAWWASPGHKANILGDYGPNGEMGMAHVGDYWAQTFGQP
ncbi:MAG: hypothetical protein JXB47_18770 [Anaerolineae bacterium]|nr:hypothetical protein [Anaerolineae bacterium]